MNRIALFVSLLASVPSAFAAGTTGIAPGSLATTGSTLDHHALYAATYNPALADLTVRPGESWRFNYFVGLGTNLEIGDANDFIDDIDELIDILDDPSLAEGSIQETLDRFNETLAIAGDEGYAKNSTRVYLPGLPAYFSPSFMKGTLFVEAAVDTQWRLSLMDDELSYNDQNGSFETNSVAYVKSGIQQRISVGYGRELFSETSLQGFGGKLLAGFKVNLYKMDLSKQLFLLQEMDGEDIQDVIEDEYENNLVSTSAASIDAGLVWDANWYRLGLTFNDINSPEFEYGAVGVYCETHAEGSVARSNCEATREFTEASGEIRSHEIHTKHASATFDAAIFPTANWSITGSSELSAYDDIVGSENQWVSVATTYTPNNFFIPALRVGMQKNLVGSELTTYGVGFTLFKALSLDLSTSSETVEHDGTEVPRRVSFSLSFEESF